MMGTLAWRAEGAALRNLLEPALAAPTGVRLLSESPSVLSSVVESEELVVVLVPVVVEPVAVELEEAPEEVRQELSVERPTVI